MSDHSHATAEHEPEEALTTYTLVFIALLVLLGLTYAAYLKDLGPTANLLIALIIAVIKAGLVIFIFMHVRLSPKLVWIFALSSFLWLVLMICGFLQDYGSRPLDGVDAHQFISPQAAAMQHGS